MNTKAKSEYLDILQVFRGIAALMVVLHHSVGSIKYYHKTDYPFLSYIGLIGKFGVDFFFVLSGFIITYSAYYKYNEPNSFKNYIKNRLIRIYVPYLPIGIFMLIVYALLPGFSNGNRNISVLTSLTLIPHGNPALSVAWTLSFELCFYLLFSISFYSKRAWNWFISVWLIFIFLFTYSPFSYSKNLENPFFKILFSMYNFEFILGYILALLIVSKIRLPTFPLFSVLFLALILFFYYTFTYFTLFLFDVNLLFAIIAFLSIFVVTTMANFKINKNSVLMIVGNATYSIYLIHNPLQMILIRIYPNITSIVSLIVAMIVVLILSSAIGYVYYLVFEKWAIHSIKFKIIK